MKSEDYRGLSPCERKERKSYDEHGKTVSIPVLVSIDFNPAVVDPEDVETLSDMTAQALNHALAQIDEATQKKMGAFAGKLPF